jgi:hypothetical protein
MLRCKHYNYNYDEDAMVVINYQEQLQPGTFEHAVHYLSEHKLDLSVFHPKYRNDDTGRLPYDPYHFQSGNAAVLRDQHYLQGAVLRHGTSLHDAGEVRQWSLGRD